MLMLQQQTRCSPRVVRMEETVVHEFGENFWRVITECDVMRCDAMRCDEEPTVVG